MLLGPVLAVLLGLAGPAQSAIFNVNTAADTPGPGGCGGARGDCSLRQALTLANGNPDATNVIKLPGNHYTLSGGVLTISKTLTLQGGGAASTVIDGAHGSGVFLITGGSPVVTTINDVTITNGSVTAAGSQGGAGIFNQGGPLTLNRDSLTNNAVQASSGCCNGGGAIFNLGGDLTISQSTLTHNSFTEAGANGCCNGGGAIHTGAGNLTLSASAANANSASITGNQQCCNGGGAFYIETGSLTLTQTHTDGNTLTIGTSQCCNGGGGLYTNSSTGSVTVNGGSVNHNTVQWASQDCCNGGGGIYNNTSAPGTQLVVSNASVTGNTAGQSGGAAQCCNGGGGIFQGNGKGGLSLTGVTVAGNTATVTAGPNSSGGGGVFDNGTATSPVDTVLNTTIAGNVANVSNADSSDGGNGYYARNATSFTNVTLDGNSGNVAAGLFINGPVTLANSILAGDSSRRNCAIGGGSLTSHGYNIESGDTCHLGSFGDHKNTNPLLDVLKDNGGPTLTQALLVGSPAIDLINRGQCPATDQRGLPRPDDAETTCDSGAYETPRGPYVTLIGTPLAIANGVRIRLRCSAAIGARCRTRETLARGIVVVGVKTAVLAPGDRRRIIVRLNRRGMDLLRRSATLPVTLTISVAIPAQAPFTITRRLTIRRPIGPLGRLF